MPLFALACYYEYCIKSLTTNHSLMTLDNTYDMVQNGLMNCPGLLVRGCVFQFVSLNTQQNDTQT